MSTMGEKIRLKKGTDSRDRPRLFNFKAAKEQQRRRIHAKATSVESARSKTATAKSSSVKSTEKKSGVTRKKATANDTAPDRKTSTDIDVKKVQSTNVSDEKSESQAKTNEEAKTAESITITINSSRKSTQESARVRHRDFIEKDKLDDILDVVDEEKYGQLALTKNLRCV
jgi:hypothetical protein